MDPQVMVLTTKSGVRIDVESFVNCRYGYDIKCEVVCEEGTLNLPEPANAMIRTNAARITPICTDWSQRFVEAYNIEFQEWINATKAGRVDGPTAWDGYVGQVTAKTASKARDLGQAMSIEIEECPAFYQR
jgi:myo-inositol 2-dehydrogenase/D-chiro-inositol 1-dehydrogenase